MIRNMNDQRPGDYIPSSPIVRKKNAKSEPVEMRTFNEMTLILYAVRLVPALETPHQLRGRRVEALDKILETAAKITC